MKKYIVCLLCLWPFLSQAISVYQVTYSFTGDEKTLYEAFLVRNDANGGFIRVRYTNDKQQICLVNMDFTEEYRDNQLYLLFKGNNPSFMRGQGSYNPDYFWFKKDFTTNKYNTYAVSSPGTDGKSVNGSIGTFKLLDLGKLSKSFVQKFFDEEEDFYQNLFAETEISDDQYDQQPVLHLILVADTWDKSIGSSCREEEGRVYDYFEQIAKQSGMQFDADLIDDGDFTKANVQAAITRLQPGRNDAVVFYYSGHGFRFNNDTDPYPRVDIRTNDFDNLQSNSLSLSYIYNSIKAKNARLNLILGDCCNSYAGLPRFLVGGSSNMDRSLNTLSGNNCKQLFLQSKANIIATAATKGQYALCDNGPGGGGLFTKAFLSALDYQLSTFNTRPTWNGLLEKARSQTAYSSENARCQNVGSCMHNPIYYVDAGTETPVSNPPRPTATTPRATIDKIWVEHNETEKGQLGMRIHVKFNIYHYKGIKGYALAYFFDKTGTALRDFNQLYYTSDGKVSASTDFVPGYDNTVYNDLAIFIPYSELHVNKGKWDLKLKVEIHRSDLTTGYTLAVSDWEEFYYTDN